MKLFAVVVVAALFQLSLGKSCNKKGGFNNQNKAEKWAEDYCECFDLYMECTTSTCITELWEDEHASGVVITQDGYAMDFDEWNTRMLDARAFVDVRNSYMADCVMDTWTSSSIAINETIILFLDIGKPFSLEYSTQKFKINSRIAIDFDSSGDISSKVYVSKGGAINIILTAITAMSEAANGVFPGLPDTAFGELFSKTGKFVIVFGGLVVLTMYLSLLFVVFKLFNLCVSAGVCRKGAAPSKGYVITSSDTEAEEVGLNQ